MERYQCVDEKTVPKHCLCLICTDVVADPVKLTCQCRYVYKKFWKCKKMVGDDRRVKYCRTCLTKSIKQDPRCPQCREKVDVTSIKKIDDDTLFELLGERSHLIFHSFRNLLRRPVPPSWHDTDEIRSFCLEKSFDCAWQGPRSNVKEHHNTCSVRKIKEEWVIFFRSRDDWWKNRIQSIQRPLVNSVIEVIVTGLTKVSFCIPEKVILSSKFFLAFLNHHDRESFLYFSATTTPKDVF